MIPAVETPEERADDDTDVYVFNLGEADTIATDVSSEPLTEELTSTTTTKETLSSIIPTSAITVSSNTTAAAEDTSTATVVEETTDETADYDNLIEEAIITEGTEPPTATEEFLEEEAFNLNFEETTTIAPGSTPDTIVFYVETTESFVTPASQTPAVSDDDVVSTTLVSTLSGHGELATTMAVPTEASPPSQEGSGLSGAGDSEIHKLEVPKPVIAG